MGTFPHIVVPRSPYLNLDEGRGIFNSSNEIYELPSGSWLDMGLHIKPTWHLLIGILGFLIILGVILSIIGLFFYL